MSRYLLYDRCIDIQWPDGFETALNLRPAPNGQAVDLRVAVSANERPGGLSVDSGSAFRLDDNVELGILGRTVLVMPSADIGALALEHYLLDHALPIGLSALGDLMVHGAGVWRNGLGVLLCGSSGAGKSTLSAWLHGRGWSFLGDDTVRIEQPAIGPPVLHGSYASARLHADVLEGPLDRLESMGLVTEYGTKARVSLKAPDRWEAPLHTVLFLGEDLPKLRVGELGPAAICARLAGNAMNSPGPTSEAPARLEAFVATATAVSGFVVEYPRTVEGLVQIEAFLGSLA